jgi:hypothetical protein
MVGSNYIKKLIRVFSNNSDATYRTIIINNNMVFYCIRFPRLKNNPTMIFLDNDLTIDWMNAYNVVSGTYFVKQQYYPIDSFTTV